MILYSQNKFGDIVRVADDATIPTDLNNTDYAAYLAYVQAGGETAPYIEPPQPVPQSASKLGLQRALREAGVWTSIKAAIAADETMQEDWDAAQEIRRNDPLTQAMISELGLKKVQVDKLLIRANELVA